MQKAFSSSSVLLFIGLGLKGLNKIGGVNNSVILVILNEFRVGLIALTLSVGGGGVQCIKHCLKFGVTDWESLTRLGVLTPIDNFKIGHWFGV